MLGKNKCMKCGKPATNKITKIESGQVRDYYLCAEHASQASPYQGLSLSSILDTLLKKDLLAEPAMVPTPVKPGLRCAHCGLPFDSYKKNLMLGCSECYNSFRDDLLEDLHKIHGSTQHAGRCPGGAEAPARPSLPPSPSALEHEAAGIVPKKSPTAGGEILLKDPRQAIHELNRAMQNAILAEDYTRAAIYRDQIRELQDRIKKEA